MAWGRSSRVWCTSMSFVGLDGVCVAGHDLLRDLLGLVEQPSAWARAVAPRRARCSSRGLQHGEHGVQVEGSSMARMKFES